MINLGSLAWFRPVLGGRRLVLFDDVDITTMIDVRQDGKEYPVGHIIRAANRKTFRQIHDEIRAIQARAAASGGGWGLALPNHTLGITVGGIAEKPGVHDGQIAVREYLNVTLDFDHDIVDGAPASRFDSDSAIWSRVGAGCIPPDSAASHPSEPSFSWVCS